MKLVVVIKPFEYSQMIYLFDEENNVMVEKIGCKIAEVDNKAFDLAIGLAAKEIDISGPISYTQKIKSDIMKREQRHYNENKLIINLI